MNLKEDVLLKNYSTFKIGGPAKYFCVCESLDELREVLGWARDNDEKTFILGGGSNILFGDKGFDGVVIKIMNNELRIMNQESRITNKLKKPLNLPSKKRGGRGIKIVCGAGVSLSKLINFSIENGLAGLEWAVGIPGTVGGAVRGNAGAFGGEMKDSVSAVRIVEIQEEGNKVQDARNKQIPNTNSKIQIQKFDNKQCRFDYRSSVFKRGRDLIVWEVVLDLERGNKDESDRMIKEILLKRREKQPFQYSSAGSVFKNPVVSEEIRKSFEADKKVECKDDKVPAGWLIEKCGLKSKKIGGAMVSEKQANFIVNVGNATADDVIILISLIKQKVRNGFGVQLQEEIEIVYW
jgi:UDP-N-acetylmuramate dehydrogenase